MESLWHHVGRRGDVVSLGVISREGKTLHLVEENIGV